MNTPSRSITSPRVPRTSASSSRRSSLLQGLKKISSKYSASGRSNQSVQVVCKTPYHVVEGFGTSLPMLVTEALTFSDRSAAVSVCISTDGWAWFVCGRRLLIWQYKQTFDIDRHRALMNSHCQELTLPPSDLAHKAELVTVFTAEGNTVPSCIAVSPEGTVRYWPSVQHEGVSVEDSADLQGQECHSLTSLGPAGCILATTTSTLLLVEPRVTPAGRHAIACRPLRVPHGWLGLGGLGRRVSSLIFGSLPSAQVMETRLVKVVAVRANQGQWSVYALSEQSLQKWQLQAGEPERLLCECEISQMAREAFHETVWERHLPRNAAQESCAGSAAELDMWMLDMQPTDGEVVILAAAVNTQLSPQLHYALGKLSTEGVESPVKFISFCPLKNTGFYREDSDSEVQGFQFLMASQAAYLYNKKAIFAVSASSFSEETDVIEFMGSGDRLLGAALCGSVPVFFSKLHGLVSVSPADISPHDLVNSSMSMSDMPSVSDITISQMSETGLNITVTEAELNEFSINKDFVTRLKAAFLYFVKNRRDLSQCEQILKETFPADDPVNEVNAKLDTVAVKLSQDLINDAPVSDPRWAEVKPGGSSIGYASLQIEHQLEDKSRALELFVLFLKEVKLWDRFGVVLSHTGAMATSYVLGEHAEKLVAAISLHKLQAEYGTIAEAVLKKVLLERDERPSGGLSCQDLFYKEVSDMHHFFQVITRWSEEIVESDRQPQEIVRLLVQINSVILAVLQDVVQFRQQKAEVFSPIKPANPELCEYVPWTAAPGNGGLKDSLLKLEDLTLRHGARCAGDLELRSQLYDQVVHLIDLLLDGRKCQVESIRTTSKFHTLLHLYERERYELIDALLDDEEYERAAILAEKYCDFEILIKICEKTDNKNRLEMYIEKFSDQGFAKFLFGRYVHERKYGELLELHLYRAKPAEQQQQFTQFLRDHPSLLWVQDVFAGRFRQAGETLTQLAQQETELLRRKKSMVSLSKLALLASGQSSRMLEPQLNQLNTQLELINCQEDLPDAVLTAYGYDADKFPVLSATEIIKMYICDENVAANETDFKKALELLPFIEDEFERSEMRHIIWCQAILRDRWQEMSTTSPLDTIQQTIFFKIVDLMLIYGRTAEEVLPPLGRLLESSELGTLKDNNNFKYLLKLGYEYVERTCKDVL